VDLVRPFGAATAPSITRPSGDAVQIVRPTVLDMPPRNSDWGHGQLANRMPPIADGSTKDEKVTSILAIVVGLKCRMSEGAARFIRTPEPSVPNGAIADVKLISIHLRRFTSLPSSAA
jgi:hypothetical protein